MSIATNPRLCGPTPTDIPTPADCERRAAERLEHACTLAAKRDNKAFEGADPILDGGGIDYEVDLDGLVVASIDLQLSAVDIDPDEACCQIIARLRKLADELEAA